MFDICNSVAATEQMSYCRKFDQVSQYDLLNLLNDITNNHYLSNVFWLLPLLVWSLFFLSKRFFKLCQWWPLQCIGVVDYLLPSCLVIHFWKKNPKQCTNSFRSMIFWCFYFYMPILHHLKNVMGTYLFTLHWFSKQTDVIILKEESFLSRSTNSWVTMGAIEHGSVT